MTISAILIFKFYRDEIIEVDSFLFYIFFFLLTIQEFVDISGFIFLLLDAP